MQLLYLVSGNLWSAGAVFFGLWLIPMGWCVLRSGWMPQPLGWILIGGGIGYVLSALVGYLAPDARLIADALTYPATVGELWMVGYLLVRGVRRTASPAHLTDAPERNVAAGATRSQRQSEVRRQVADDAVEDVGVEVDAELVGHGQQKGVRGGDRLVLGQRGDELVRLTGVRLAEACVAAVQPTHLIGAGGLPPEQLAIKIADDREDAPAHRHPRLAVVAGRRPRGMEPLDLLGLQLVEGHTGVLGEKASSSSD